MMSIQALQQTAAAAAALCYYQVHSRRPGVRCARSFGRIKLALSMSNDATSFTEGMQEELRKFQGRWKQIAYERDGETEPLDEQGWEPITTFTGENFVVTIADGSVPIRGTYRIDPTQDPKTVDWTDAVGEDAGETLLAIYSLQGNRLIFCASYPGLERPTEFRTRPGQVLRVFQREAQG